MAGKFFVEHKVAELHAAAVEALMKAPDAFDAPIKFTGARAKALLTHQVGIANLVADATVGRISLVQAATEILDVRVKRLEAICDFEATNEGETQALYYADDIAAQAVAIKKLQQQISALTKQLAALDRKVHS